MCKTFCQVSAKDVFAHNKWHDNDKHDNGDGDDEGDGMDCGDGSVKGEKWLPQEQMLGLKNPLKWVVTQPKINLAWQKVVAVQAISYWKLQESIKYLVMTMCVPVYQCHTCQKLPQQNKKMEFHPSFYLVLYL